MGTLYFYTGFPEEVTVFTGTKIGLIHATLVYQADGLDSPLGFDSDLFGSQVVGVLCNGGLHYETTHSEFYILPSSAESMISIIRKWPTVTILGEPQELGRFRDEITRYRSIEKKKFLKAKFGLEITQLPATPLLLSLLENNGKILNLGVASQVLATNVHALLKWRITDFGLHCYYVSNNKEYWNNLLVRLAQHDNLRLTECNSEREIPIH